MTLPSALDELPRLFTGSPTKHRSARRPALFLDYDGTLTPIVERPEDAVLAEETREVLRRLAKRFPVIVVSGRGRADVAGKVGLPELVYAGSHGFEIQGPDGVLPGENGPLRYEPARQVEPIIREVTRALERRLSEVPGTQVEPKRFTVAVHYRRVPPDRVAEVEAAVDAQVAAHPELKKGGGKKVWEIRPDLEWDKGRAVLWLIRALGLDHEVGSDRPAAGRGRGEIVPIYIGDDVTDEDAFRALSERRGGLRGGSAGTSGGIGVLVAGDEWDEERSETAARYRLRDPAEVRELLERLAALEETNETRRGEP